MKRLLIALALILAAYSIAPAQRIRKGDKFYTPADLPFVVDSASKRIVYRGIVEAPGGTVADMYDNAKTFLVKRFSVIKPDFRIDDKSIGALVAKGIAELNYPTKEEQPGKKYLGFVIDLRFKEGKYKYEVSQLDYDGMDFEAISTRMTRIREGLYTDLSRFDTAIKAFLAEMEQGIKAKEKSW